MYSHARPERALAQVRFIVHGRRDVAKVTAKVTERAAVGAFSVSCLLQRRMLFRSYSALSQAFRQALGGLRGFPEGGELL